MMSLKEYLTNQPQILLQSIPKAMVPCQNSIILKNFRPELPRSVDRPKIFLFQTGTTSEMQ